MSSSVERIRLAAHKRFLPRMVYGEFMTMQKRCLPIVVMSSAVLMFAGCLTAESGVVDERDAAARGDSGGGGWSDGDTIPDAREAGNADASSADTGSADASSADTGSADTGSADASSADTGSADTGSADTGSADAGDGAAPPPKTKALSIWHWNVAGQKIHGGKTTTGLISAVTSSIQNREADFVSLNELCFSQYKAIQTGLRDLGWPTDPDNFSRFAESRPAGTSTCAGQAYGNAIFSKAPLGAAGNYTLPSDGSAEHRNMLCAPTAVLPHLRFCTTHITTSSELASDGVAKNTRQLVDVLARLEAFHAAGDTVVIAGDFNAQPDYGRMNRFYSSNLVAANNAGNTGHYRELDDADPAKCFGYGENTDSSDLKGGPCGTGKKIDLIFVREDKIHGPYNGDALAISNACGGPCSDHNILIGSVNVVIQGL